MSQIYEYIKMAFSNIMANKVRSFLTMLGIIIGISSVILIMALGNGAKNVIAGEMAGIGKNNIALYTLDESGQYLLNRRDIEAIKENISDVRAIDIQTSYNGETRTNKGEFKAKVQGVMSDYQYFDTDGLVAGRYFTPEEEESAAAYCIINENDALRIFGSTNILGMNLEISIYGTPINFTILGIQKSDKDASAQFVYDDSEINVVVPMSTSCAAIGFNNDDIRQIMILAEDGSDTHAVAEQSLAIVNRRHQCKSDDDIYRVENFTDYMEIVDTVINMVTVLISLIAAISLVVGGIGVMNIMLVSVTERTREIGIRKALGAKTRSIMMQFLAESAIITMIGGGLGILLGIGNANLIAGIIEIAKPSLAFTPSISARSVLMATLFSSAIGLFFGIYPAKKAAKLSPIEALRRN